MQIAVLMAADKGVDSWSNPELFGVALNNLVVKAGNAVVFDAADAGALEGRLMRDGVIGGVCSVPGLSSAEWLVQCWFR